MSCTVSVFSRVQGVVQAFCQWGVLLFTFLSMSDAEIWNSCCVSTKFRFVYPDRILLESVRVN